MDRVSEQSKGESWRQGTHRDLCWDCGDLPIRVVWRVGQDWAKIREVKHVQGLVTSLWALGGVGDEHQV